MVEKIIKSKNATEDAALSHTDLHQAIRSLLLTTRAQVRQTINTAMVQTYWHIGRMIVEDEQGGQKRAAYGKQVLLELTIPKHESGTPKKLPSKAGACGRWTDKFPRCITSGS